MCVFREIRVYNCGHERISADFQQSPFCLFRLNTICQVELGKYRVFEAVVDNWCPQCAHAANTNIAPMSLGPGQSTAWGTPHALPHEVSIQTADRNMLRSAALTPNSRPVEFRLEQLNGMAQRNLAGFIASLKALDATICSNVIMYIASLAPWLDRQALVNKLAPWFAELLDEDHQICVRPNLKSMGCEQMLDDIMVWTRKSLV
ncbi:hypothetical protein F5Y13DRAFT_187652 [Hypoxylon sp. FL1857]|nr:hypothetical protein F5Y13DRAFT_187652 [Hypoxylon sp. FL1857]